MKSIKKIWKKMSRLKKIVFSILVFIAIIGINFFLFYGLGKDEIETELNRDFSLFNYKKLNFYGKDSLMNSRYYFKVEYSLDWSESVGTNPWNKEAHIPGVVSVGFDLPIFDIIDAFQGQSGFFIPISNNGVTIKKNRSEILSKSVFLDKEEELLFNKKIDLIYSISKKYYRKPSKFNNFPWEIVFPSNLPQSIPIVNAYGSLKKDKTSFFEWVEFAIINHKFAANRLIQQNQTGTRQNSYFGKVSPFIFSIDNNKVKFGVKKVKINEYGEIIKNSTKFQEVEAIFRSDLNEWKFVASRNIIVPSDKDVETIVETSNIIREITYNIGILILVYFFLLFASRIASFLKVIFGSKK